MTTNESEKQRRRKRILLRNSIFIFIGYFLPMLLSLIASYLQYSSITIYQITLIFGSCFLACIVVILIIKIKKSFSDKFSTTLYIVHFAIWISLFGIWIIYLNEIRYVGLLFAYTGLIFLMSKSAFIISLIVTFIVGSVYFAATVVAIYLLNQNSSIFKEIFYIMCFIPSGIFISYMAGIFKNQNKEIILGKKQAEISRDAMLKELELAQRIQRQIIPKDAPTDFINSLYFPMEKVGGDFYDFVFFRETGQIGIFLSDVSGHGVAAAFITSMVKTSLMQAGISRENPSVLLHYLNKILYSQTDGNFITTFYCIYDPHTRKLSYSNAGHNPPYIISSSEIKRLPHNKSLPIAVMDNESLEKNGKNYVTTTLTLEPNSKLLLYTDGLTEARHKEDDSLYFENYDINNIFQELFHYKSKDFIQGLYKKLIDFKGSNTFEDDICMICIDII